MYWSRRLIKGSRSRSNPSRLNDRLTTASPFGWPDQRRPRRAERHPAFRTALPCRSPRERGPDHRSGRSGISDHSRTSRPSRRWSTSARRAGSQAADERPCDTRRPSTRICPPTNRPAKCTASEAAIPRIRRIRQPIIKASGTNAPRSAIGTMIAPALQRRSACRPKAATKNSTPQKSACTRRRPAPALDSSKVLSNCPRRGSSHAGA